MLKTNKKFFVIFCLTIVNMSHAKSLPCVDFIAYSYDRPMQLYALLESIQTHMDGIGTGYIIYRMSEPKYEQPYQQVKKVFKQYKFLLEKDTITNCFQKLTKQCFFDSPSEYIMLAMDDDVVKDHVDLWVATMALKATDAFGFFLRLGKNITECYSEKIHTPPPPLIFLAQDVYMWTFKDGRGDWNFPINTDMTVYKKSDIALGLVKTLDTCTFSNWEGLWAQSYADHNRVGLCFGESKIFNHNINLTKPEKYWGQFSQEWLEKMDRFSPSKLLDMFNDNSKIDISTYYKFKNNAPHVEMLPKFTKRK